MNPPPNALRRYHAARSLDQQPFQSACYAPFVSLYFHTNGDVVACCKSTHHRLGNVTRQSLAEIWHGERATAMRAAGAASDRARSASAAARTKSAA